MYQRPTKEFFSRYSRCRLVSIPSSGGTCPLSLFPSRARSVKLDRLPRNGGIGPSRSLSDADKVRSTCKDSSCGGRLPVKQFPLRFRTSRLVSSPSSAGNYGSTTAAPSDATTTAATTEAAALVRSGNKAAERSRLRQHAVRYP